MSILSGFPLWNWIYHIWWTKRNEKKSENTSKTIATCFWFFILCFSFEIHWFLVRWLNLVCCLLHNSVFWWTDLMKRKFHLINLTVFITSQKYCVFLQQSADFNYFSYTWHRFVSLLSWLKRVKESLKCRL